MLWAALAGWPAMAAGQALTPLGDVVEEPLLPTGISHGDVEVFGTRLYLFKAEDGADVIHVMGEFELHLAQRRYLSAREAVIFLTGRSWNDTGYRHFEIYLRRDAQATEPAGTLTSGPMLFVILNSAGQVTLGADDVARASTADSGVYRDAAEVRRVVAAAQPGDVDVEPAMQVIDLRSARGAMTPRIRPAVSYQADRLEAGDIEGRQVVSAIGNVYVFQGSEQPGGPALELRADAAVIFMKPADEQAQAEDTPAVQQPPRDLTEKGRSSAIGALPAVELDIGGGASQVEGIYLEGDVVLTRGERMIRSPQLYYDLANNKALILDAVARVIEPKRGVPIYVRAEQVRQLSATQYAAWNAKISTSEFYSPHFSIGAGEVRFTDRTARSPDGQTFGLSAGSYVMRDTTFRLNGFPILYWPYSKGEFKQSESILRGVRIGFGNKFGTTVETQWQLFNLLGLSTPIGFEATLRLDYLSDRGPAVGLDVDYKRDTYFGLFRGYYINDGGNDTLGRFRDENPPNSKRGRTTWRHRQYLPNGWQLTAEFSHITDRGFLQEYFENEFEQGKEQETLLFLKKQQDTWAFTALAQWRIIDWLDQTEHLPDLTFRVLGESLGEVATFYSENRAGFVRYRVGEREIGEKLFLGAKSQRDDSGTVARVDSRQEVEFPFTLGPVKIVPFASVRGSAWDDSPASGGLQRAFGTLGVRAGMYLSRAYSDVQSRLLDVDGIRHIIKPDITAWVAGSNIDSDELYPFTENVDDIDETDGVTLGLRQRWQTHRGAPGRKRAVDVVSWDVELGFFNDAQSAEFTNGFASYSRPENSISQNYLNSAFNWRINDSTALISEANVDLNDGELDIFDLSMVVERDPRLGYIVGYRFIRETDSNLLALGANYRLTEKHTIAFRETFDLQRGQTQEFTIGFIRKFPRWYAGLTMDLNEADDDFGVSISAWPEGLPRLALGSRRFTGLTQSTGIRPE
ncbi:MAG: LPS assembly protein LptD [Phycisphaerae bacterium]